MTNSDSSGDDVEDGYRRTVEADELISVAIVEAVAAAAGADPSNLPEVLYDVVDADALERLFLAADDGGAVASVTFPYCGHRVCVRADRTVVVRAASGRRE